MEQRLQPTLASLAPIWMTGQVDLAGLTLRALILRCSAQETTSHGSARTPVSLWQRTGRRTLTITSSSSGTISSAIAGIFSRAAPDRAACLRSVTDQRL